MAATKEPLGRLLVDAGFLSQETLSRALAEQAQSGRPLGEIVVQRGWVAPNTVASMLVHQRGGDVVPLEGRRGAPTDEALERLTTALALVPPHAGDADARETIADEVRDALAAYEARLDDELAARQAGDDRLAEREERIEALEADLRVLAVARADAGAALAAADRQAERADRLPELEVELTQASAARDEALSALSAVTAFAAARGREVKEARAELEARAAETADLRRRLEAEAERRAHADGMLSERDGRVTALEESLRHLQAAHEEAIASVAALSAFAGARAEDLERAQSELASRTEEAAELRRRLEHEVELRSRSEGALAERDELEEVVARLARVHAERDEVHAARKLERASEELRRAERERAEREARLDAAETVRRQLAAELDDARAVLDRRPVSAGPAAEAPAAEAPAPEAPAPEAPAAEARVAAAPEAPAHVLFAALPNRYALVERPGPPPAVGEAVELAVGETSYRFRVARVGRRPLPGTVVPCAYLEPV